MILIFFLKVDLIIKQYSLTLIEQWGKELNFNFNAEFKEIVYTFNLKFENKSRLKIDFGYYPYIRIEKGGNLNGIEVDSLSDIAVNKLLTVSQRTNVKDFEILPKMIKPLSLDELRLFFRQKAKELGTKAVV